MARVFIDDAILTQIAEAIRTRTGNTELIYPDDMPREIAEVIPLDSTQTFILVDEAGNELMAVLTDEETPLTATANDIRLGTTAVTDKGITSGEKVIPSYHTWQGVKAIPNGSTFVIKNIDVNVDYHDYTEMQSIVCTFNTNVDNSVAAEKVTIGNNVYDVLSTESISVIVKNADNRTIDFGISNNTGKPCIIRFFMYKEVY